MNRRKIRVLSIITRLNIGGAAIRVLTAAEHFNRRGFECLVVAGSLYEGEGDMAYLAGELGLKPVFVRSMCRDVSPLKDLIALVRIIGIILRFRPHIVHTHTAKAGMLGRIAGVVTGVPVIVHTFHGHSLRHYFGRVKNRIFTSIERLIAHLTDRIIVYSPSQCTDLVSVLKVIPKRKAVVIWFGIDLSPFLSCEEEVGRIRSELTIKESAPVVTIVARLTPVKDHALFLRAAAAVVRRIPDARFLIVGDGELRVELEQLTARLGVEKNVHFLGWRRDITAIYADSTIVAISSLNEATTLTLIEAMASRKPIVATAIGGVPDLFPEKRMSGNTIHASTGVLVDSRNPEDFAEALLTIIEDEELQNEMGARGREFAKEHLSREKFLKDLESVYMSLSRRSGSRRTGLFRDMH